MRILNFSQQAEFRQLKPLEETRVRELEQFYQTQSVSIVTQRMDAVTRLHASSLPEDYRESQQVSATWRF